MAGLLGEDQLGVDPLPGKSLSCILKAVGILNRDVSVMRYMSYGTSSGKVCGRGARARWQERRVKSLLSCVGPWAPAFPHTTENLFGLFLEYEVPHEMLATA